MVGCERSCGRGLARISAPVQTKSAVAPPNSPSLVRAIDPDGAEAAVPLFHDLAACPRAEDTRIFSEFAGIAAPGDPKGRQKGQDSPCEDGRGQPDPEPAKPPPGLSTGLSSGPAEVSCGLDAFEMGFANGLLGAFRGRVDGVLAQIEGGGGQALFDLLLDGRADLGHAVEALGYHGIELFRILPVQAGALQQFDLPTHQIEFFAQNIEGVSVAHGSPAPALCALASSSANSPTSSF